MFIAMNRFQVVKGSEEAFERMWQNRDSYLNEMAGFVEFHLLRGPEAEDHTLFTAATSATVKNFTSEMSFAGMAHRTFCSRTVSRRIVESLAHGLGEPGGIRGMDQVGAVPPRACPRRQ